LEEEEEEEEVSRKKVLQKYLCYCCREVVPTSDGAGGKRILYIYVF
jgi:hypothetical protein